MRAVWIAAFCLLAAGCVHEARKQDVGADILRGYVCGDQSPADGTLETLKIAATAGRVRRQGHLLSVGSAKLVDDLDDDGNYAKYTYVGRMAGTMCDLVHVTQYEGEGWLAINESGGQTLLSGVPIPSPDGSVFAVVANGGAQYESTVSLYKAQAGPVLIVHIPVFSPCGGTWDSPDRFSFNTFTSEPELDPNAPHVIGRMIREKGKWRYEGPRAPGD